MRVKLAAQVFSHTVTAGILAKVATSKFFFYIKLEHAKTWAQVRTYLFLFTHYGKMKSFIHHNRHSKRYNLQKRMFAKASFALFTQS